MMVIWLLIDIVYSARLSAPPWRGMNRLPLNVLHFLFYFLPSDVSCSFILLSSIVSLSFILLSSIVSLSFILLSSIRRLLFFYFAFLNSMRWHYSFCLLPSDVSRKIISTSPSDAFFYFTLISSIERILVFYSNSSI